MLSLTENSLNQLVSAALVIVSEREAVIDAIKHATEDQVRLQQELQAAVATVTAEEFSAAQEDGGLAIASQTSQKALADAQLRVKTINLRLTGLNERRRSAEASLTESWRELNRQRDKFRDAMAADVGVAFDKAAQTLVTEICKCWALSAHRVSLKEPCETVVLANPVTAVVYVNRDELYIEGGKFRSLRKGNWSLNPQAAALGEAITAVDEKLAPIALVMRQVEPER